MEQFRWIHQNRKIHPMHSLLKQKDLFKSLLRVAPVFRWKRAQREMPRIEPFPLAGMTQLLCRIDTRKQANHIMKVRSTRNCLYFNEIPGFSPPLSSPDICDVIGQEAVITTLKNALHFDRVAHAYLFCGSRGVGKTTVARLFAKALNCLSPTPDHEPCNQCPSCLEILSGQSLDVMEIDGASNRGIDDIRQLNETMGYAPSHGKYKIYIIDEVHMLTKEAFNALLKTLEEPPEKAKFFFATTEPHKVLPTIISRCQRFDLQRLSEAEIARKLLAIAADLTKRTSTGSDLPDCVLCRRFFAGRRISLRSNPLFYGWAVGIPDVRNVLGLVPDDLLFSLDSAFNEGRVAYAFELVEKPLSDGQGFGTFPGTAHQSLPETGSGKDDGDPVLEFTGGRIIAHQSFRCALHPGAAPAHSGNTVKCFWSSA